MKPRFALFWSVALVSNTASAAQLVAVMWLLSDPAFSPWVLVNYQLVTVAGSLLGIACGSAIVARQGVRTTLLLSTAVEALAALVVAIGTTAWETHASESRAVLLGAACAFVPLGAGLGGPAWLALVVRWPGTGRNRDAQLLLDGAQFQLGRLAGPLVAGWVLSSAPEAVARIAWVNFLTFIAVASVVAGVRPIHEITPENRSSDPPAAPPRRSLWRVPVTGAIALSAVAVDSTRMFLARYMREVNETESMYASCLALIALGGAVTAFSLSRSKRGLEAFGPRGCLVAAAALASWAAAPWVGSWAWLLGSALLGPSVAIISASFTGSLIRAAGPDRESRGAATAMSARTAAGSAGGVAQSLLIPLVGTLAIFGAAALMVLAWYASRPRAVDGRLPRSEPLGERTSPDVV